MKQKGNGIGIAAGRIATAVKVLVARRRETARRERLIAERKARAAATPALTNLAARPTRGTAWWVTSICETV